MNNNDYINLKNIIIQNEKICQYMGKWGFINFNEIIKNKYIYIYDFVFNFFGKNNNYDIPINNKLYYFELRIINDYILFIIDKRYYDILLPEYRTDWLIYNIYMAHYMNNKKIIRIYDIENKKLLVSKANKIIHWIWFRKDGYKLHNLIMRRAYSWIVLNPDFTFYFWTDINDEDELNDFISELQLEYKQLFLSKKINIIYNKDLLYLVKQFFKRNNIGNKILVDMFCRKNKYEIIYKTDYIRYIILHEFGGIYTDFNDCICLYPMNLFLTIYENDFIFGRDSDEEHKKYDYNNYFIYTKKNNKNLLEYTINSLKLLPKLIKFITELSLIQSQIKIFLIIMKEIKNNDISITFLDKLKKIYIEDFLKITYLDMEFKDNIIVNLKNKNIPLIILQKYLDFVKDYEENIIDIINELKTGIITKKESLNIELLEKFLNYNFETNIDDLLSINTGMYLDLITSITNIPFYVYKYYKTTVKTLNNCYLLKYMCFLSFIGHLYDNTSFGIERNYIDSTLNDLSFYKSL
jgi:mannosyltransferase OCH1-like enzyme